MTSISSVSSGVRLFGHTPFADGREASAVAGAGPDRHLDGVSGSSVSGGQSSLTSGLLFVAPASDERVTAAAEADAAIAAVVAYLTRATPGQNAQSGSFDEARSRFAEFVSASAPGVAGMEDVNALVQRVLRESYLDFTEDLYHYAQKVKALNAQKKQIREELTAARNSLARSVSAKTATSPQPASASAPRAPSGGYSTDWELYDNRREITQSAMDRLGDDWHSDPQVRELLTMGKGKNQAVNEQFGSYSNWTRLGYPPYEYGGQLWNRTERSDIPAGWNKPVAPPTDEGTTATEAGYGAEGDDAKAQLEAHVQGLEEELSSVGDDAQLANVDLQNILQKQQQVLQMLSNVSKMLHDTALAVIRKLS